MFEKAQRIIQDSQVRGDNTEILKCYYSAAKEAWNSSSGPTGEQGKMSEAKDYLDMILIPEPIFLPTFILYLSFFLFEIREQWKHNDHPGYSFTRIMGG